MIYGNSSIMFSPSKWNLLKNQKDKSIKKLDWCGSNYEGNLGCCFNNETKIQHLKRSKFSFERSLAHLPILE